MRISGSSLGQRNLHYVRRRSIGILIVWIIIAWKYRYRIVRPPVWTVDASNDSSAEKSAEDGPSWRIPAVIVSGIAAKITSAIMAASARVSGMPMAAAASMTAPVAILSIRGEGKSHNGCNHAKRDER